MATPLLAARAAEGIDSSSLRFLTASALEARRREKKKAEKERKERLMQEIHRKVRADQPVTEWAAVGRPGEASAPPPLRGRGRRGGRSVFVAILFFKVVDVPVLYNDEFQQSKKFMSASNSDASTTLGHSGCASGTGAWFYGAENCGRSAVAVHRWPSTSLSCCRGSSMVQTVQQIIETPQLQFVARWSLLWTGLLHPCGGAMAFSHGPECVCGPF